MKNEIRLTYIMMGICLILLSGFLLNANAQIDIYYPDNTTSELWIANQTDPGFDRRVTDTIPTDDYTCIVIRNQVNESVSLIDDPITFINTFVKIFYAVVFCFAIVMFAYIFKRVIL